MEHPQPQRTVARADPSASGRRPDGMAAYGVGEARFRRASPVGQPTAQPRALELRVRRCGRSGPGHRQRRDDEASREESPPREPETGHSRVWARPDWRRHPLRQPHPGGEHHLRPATEDREVLSQHQPKWVVAFSSAAKRTDRKPRPGRAPAQRRARQRSHLSMTKCSPCDTRAGPPASECIALVACGYGSGAWSGSAEECSSGNSVGSSSGAGVGGGA